MNTSPWPKFCRWAAAAFCFSFVAALLAAEVRIAFDVPSGEARDTLKKFAQQASREIVFSPVGAIQTQAVKGQFTVREALDRLLAGTDLTAFEDAKTGGVVVRRGDDPNAPRAVPLVETKDGPARSNETGRENPVIELSPFVIDASKETGWSQPRRSAVRA